MKPTAHIRPVSYIKAHAAELIRQIQEAREPVIVTRNGEAKAVLQDIASYEEDRTRNRGQQKPGTDHGFRSGEEKHRSHWLRRDATGPQSFSNERNSSVQHIEQP